MFFNEISEQTGRECILRASGGKKFENLTPQHQTWCHLCGFDVCTGLPKKTLNTSHCHDTLLIKLPRALQRLANYNKPGLKE